jgi:hypothetical protein
MKHFTLLFLIFNTLFSLSIEDEEYQFYKQKYPNENAVILNHNQEVKINIDKKTGELVLLSKDYEEVLYLSESAKFYTTRSIFLSEYFQDIVDVNVTIIKPNGKKIKLTQEDFSVVDSKPSSWVFHDDDKEMVFNLQELGEGYKTIIDYTKRLKKPDFFGVLRLMSMYPIENQKITISHDMAVILNFTAFNFNHFNVKKYTNEAKGIVTNKWELKDVIAYNYEDGSLNSAYYLPQVVSRIEKYTFNGKETEVMSSVDNLHAFFEKLLLAKGNENDRGELNRIVRDITLGMASEFEKMDTIFKWVQTNIKYIAFEDGINGFVPRACSKVINNRYGDCKDMGNLLVEMLSYANVNNAHVAWVGTRDIAYLMSEIPSPISCNHVICVVDKPDGGYYYLDATGSELSYLAPPSNIQGKEILVHNAEGEYKLVKIKAVDSDKNKFISKVKFKFTGKDSLHGNGLDTYHGYQRERRSYQLKNYEKLDLDEYMKQICLNGISKFTLTDYSIENLYENNTFLNINYNFSFQNTVIKDGDDYLFNPDLFDLSSVYYSKVDYKQSRLKEYHKNHTYIYQIEITDDFIVKYLPPAMSYKHELFDFTATFVQEGNIITVTKNYRLDLLEVPTSLFDDWNAFSKVINTSSVQNIIFSKKQ